MAIILIIFLFIPLQYKLYEGKDFICFVLCLFPVPGAVPNIELSLDKYLLNEWMNVCMDEGS